MSGVSKDLLRNFEISVFASLNAKPRLGVNERARQGTSEADNGVSAMQWGWEHAMSFALLVGSAS